MSLADGVKVISEEDEEWLTLDLVRQHLRIAVAINGEQQEHPDDDWLTELAIPLARQWCEEYTGLSFINRTVEISLSSFPSDGIIWLPAGPVYSITSITVGGVVIDPASYIFDNYSQFSNLSPAYAAQWPTVNSEAGAIKIRYVTGYSSSTGRIELPAPLKAAMLLLITHFWKNRAETTEVRLERIPMASQNLMKPYQIRLAVA